MQTENVKSLSAGIRKVLRPNKKGDKIRCAYLYADGTVAIWMERPDGIPGSFHTSSYWQVLTTSIQPRGKGRVVLSDHAILKLLPMATNVEWKGPSVDHGSDKTKAQGIAVGYLTIGTNGASYSDAIHFYDLSILSTGIHVQDNGDGSFGPLDKTDNPVVVNYIVKD